MIAVSVCAGAAFAAAGAAIIAPVAMWSVKSPTDHLSQSLTALGSVAIATGVCALTLLARTVVKRRRAGAGLDVLTGLIGVGLALWTAWTLRDMYASRLALPYVDSTGATIIAAAAAMAAIAAVAFSLIPARVAHSVNKRTALSAFLVAALVIPLLTYRSVIDYRPSVWQPGLTAAAAEPAPVPDVIGPVRYGIPLTADGGLNSVYAVGNGFLIDTRRELTAYDGVTGQKRWQVGDYGRSGRLVVVHRDRDDTAGIVILFLYNGLVALDGSSGEVLWRRQYTEGGKVTAATGSIDALAMTVFYSDSPGEGPDRSRTRLYSLDPATGDQRWSRPISCSNPDLSPGAVGQFGYSCWKPSIIDARTGQTTDVPGDYTPHAGPDAYVASTAWPQGAPTPEDVTRVIDTAGQVIDQIPGTYPVSSPRDGLVLLYAGRDSWVLRDYRNHRSTPVPIQAGVRRLSDLEDLHTIWLKNKLLVSTPYEREHFLQLVDPAHPADAPSVAASPCAPNQYPSDVDAAAGAVLVNCARKDLLGLVQPA